MRANGTYLQDFGIKVGKKNEHQLCIKVSVQRWLCTPTLIQGTIAQSGCIDRVQTGCVGRRTKLISQTSKNCGMHPHRVQLLHAEVSVHPVLVHFGGLRRSVVCKDTRISIGEAFAVLSRVMRKYNSVTYEVGKAKAEQAAGMFGLAADQRAVSCPSRVAKPLAKPLTGGWRSATYARSQQSAPCFSRSICSSDFMLM